MAGLKKRNGSGIHKLLGKKVIVFFYDFPDHVSAKTGILRDWDDNFISIDVRMSESRPIFKLISFPVDKVIRVEEVKDG